jgi:hypothetical protein
MVAILVAVMLAAAPQHDTVFTADGGRVVGTVIEEGPETISIRLPDGNFRRFARRQVTRIEYADGSVSTIRPTEPRPSAPPPAARPPAQPPSAPPPAPQPPAQPPSEAPPPGAPPPPQYQPPPPRYPPPYPPPRYLPPPRQMAVSKPWPGGPVSPLYFSFGLAGAFPFGEVEDGVEMSRVFDNQLDIDLEGGLRLSPHLALGLYLDLGVGDPARETRDACRAVGIGCDASRTRFGALLRYTFAPAARMTPWLSAGTGFEWAKITADDFYDDEQFSYRGWEVLRLVGGIDLRSSPFFGVGLYGGVSFGRFDRGSDSLGDFDIDRERFHTTVKAGLRFTLFP